MNGSASATTRALALSVPGMVAAAAAALPFLGALTADFVNWDDDLVVLQNEHIRGLDGERLRWMFTSVHHGHYHPLTWLSFAIDYACFGLEPAGYHAHNLLLHAFATFTFWLLLLELVCHARGAELAERPRTRWLAAACALLFAVHPLRVESVVWITERRDVLSGWLAILTAWLYLRSRRPDAARRRAFVLAHVCFLLGLLAKASGMILPAVMVLLDVWPLRRRQRGETWTRLLGEKAGFFAAALAFMVVAALAQQQSGARTSFADHGVVGRCFQSCYGLCFYALATLLPLDLCALYPLERALDVTAPRFLGSAAVVVVVAAVLWWRRHTGWLVAAGVYAVTVAPVLGFLQSGPQLVADRYSYLACLPFPALALFMLLRQQHAKVAATAVAAGVAALAWLTVCQAAVWKDSLTLWDHTLRRQPESFNAHYHHGRALLAAGRRGEALAAFRRTVQLQPREHKAWYAIGIEEYRTGHFAAALAAHERCHSLAPRDRDNLYGLAIASSRLQRFQECITWCERTQDVDPQYPHSWPVYGDALRHLGRRDEAIAAFTRAQQLDPGNAWVQQQLAELRQPR